jgi:FAD/FMN-containing dehydrogenase
MIKLKREEIQNLVQSELPEISMASDNDSLFNYGKDWIDFYVPDPSIILFPKHNAEVIRIVSFANKFSIPIVPSGGRTGLSGGATATGLEMVVSLKNMSSVIDFNAEDETITVQAGMSTQALQLEAEAKDLYFPIDFASKGTSCIGGNIATNAGGIHVIRYGMIREWVVGLKVITPLGQEMKLNNGLIKNNTGYDLRHLFIGSEGTLGIITEATIKLTRKPRETVVGILGVHDIQNVPKILSLFKKDLVLVAFEFFTNIALNHAIEYGGFSYALTRDHNNYVIFEIENLHEKGIDDLDQVISNLHRLGYIHEDAIAMDPSSINNVWKHRETIPVALTRFQPYKNDISVRTSNIPDLIIEMNLLLNTQYPDFSIVWFGHIGDGNLHVNILKPNTWTPSEFKAACDIVNEKVCQLVEKFEGSVSAEHGIGLIKKPFLRFSKSELEIEFMRSIKKIFDPNSIMNPGKIF